MLCAAIEYAKNGRPVFPCNWRKGEYAKAPLKDERLGLVNGYHDATVDLAQIGAWWAKWPWALIGGPVPLDETCLDNDPKNGGDIWELLELVKMPDFFERTCTVISGRYDGGAHYFFKRPEGDYGEAKKRLPKGIDLKDGGKGYTILPPSPHPDTGGPYFYRAGSEHLRADLPAEIHQLLLRPPAPPRPAVPNVASGVPTVAQLLGKGGPSKKALAGLLDKVANEVQGNRQAVGFWAAGKLKENGYPLAAWDALEQAMIHNGATARDIKTALRECPDGRYTS